MIKDRVFHCEVTSKIIHEQDNQYHFEILFKTREFTPRDLKCPVCIEIAQSVKVGDIIYLHKRSNMPIFLLNGSV